MSEPPRVYAFLSFDRYTSWLRIPLDNWPASYPEVPWLSVWTRSNYFTNYRLTPDDNEVCHNNFQFAGADRSGRIPTESGVRFPSRKKSRQVQVLDAALTADSVKPPVSATLMENLLTRKCTSLPEDTELPRSWE